ncbi:MAG: VOC family protein [Planctomycetota bacterium]
MQIEMLSLFTDRFAEMKRFYAEVLGFEIGTELEKYVEFAGQGVRFALCERGVMADAVSPDHYGEPPTGSPVSLAFRCEDQAAVESDFATLLAKGATQVRPPAVAPWGQYTAFFADPDGHVHELFCDVRG